MKNINTRILKTIFITVPYLLFFPHSFLTMLLTLIKGSILTLSAKYALFVGQLLHTMKANQGISLLVFVLFYIAYGMNKILFPPKKLRHIPHVSYLGAAYSLLNDKSYVTRAETVHLPFVYKNNLGIYLVRK